jgi:hypothetical protein
MTDNRDIQTPEPAQPNRSESRRLAVIRASIAVAAVLLLVVLPGFIATRPDYLRRYANMAGKVDTWSESVHAKASCQSCHVKPTFVAQAGFDARMLGEFYLAVVARSRTPKLFSAPTNSACEACHMDLRTVSPSGDIRIPHRAHVSVLKVKCVRCHEFLVHEKSPEGNNRPRMAECLTCHNGRTAKRNCSACHTNKSLPPSHRAPDWTIVHPLKQKEIDCAKCHKWTSDWCAECHRLRPRSHVAKWRTLHGAQVKLHRNCEVCHDGPFCVRCHGDVPALNFNPALKMVK